MSGPAAGSAGRPADGLVRLGTARTGTAIRDATVAGIAATALCLALATAARLAADPARPATPAATAAVVAGALLGLLIVGAAGGSLVRRSGRWSGPADRVTLTRAVLAAGCATLAGPMIGGALPTRTWTLLLLAVPALALDAVDGQVARRTGTSSPAGGKLDGELDAALLLVLSLAATRSLGAWVLAIGLMRYAFFIAGYARPVLRGRLEFSQFRRVVAGLQGVLLAIGLAPAVPVGLGRGCVAVALALLTVSFARDVVRLERDRAGHQRWVTRRE